MDRIPVTVAGRKYPLEGLGDGRGSVGGDAVTEHYLRFGRGGGGWVVDISL